MAKSIRRKPKQGIPVQQYQRFAFAAIGLAFFVAIAFEGSGENLDMEGEVEGAKQQAANLKQDLQKDGRIQATRQLALTNSDEWLGNQQQFDEPARLTPVNDSGQVPAAPKSKLDSPECKKAKAAGLPIGLRMPPEITPEDWGRMTPQERKQLMEKLKRSNNVNCPTGASQSKPQKASETTG